MHTRGWLFLIALWAARLVRQPAPRGGLVARAGTHRAYYAIPYATLTPARRFQTADPVVNWEEIQNTNNENVRCTQRFTDNFVIGQEDCLTLNVYTPLHDTTTLLPVMVFIHGGGFRDGSSSHFLYGPEYLVKHDIILVTINYRLEILGFLCLGIKEAPGNIGLKDQVQALKWIQRNIEEFGGNPTDVTLFGVSAGSSAILYHILSPMSKGLFHKAIMQSGSALSPWSFQFEPLKTASLFAKQMGYNTENPKALYEIFMNKTAEDLLKTRVPRQEGDVILSENIFVPCVEEIIPGSEPFLSEPPYKILSDGKYNKVPLIIGFTNSEGYMFVGKENHTTLSKFDIFHALPRDLEFPSYRDRREVAVRLKQLYVTDNKTADNILNNIVRYEGDAGIKYSVTATIDILLKTSTNTSIYAYKFCYDGWLNIVKLFSGFWHWPGAAHADDIFYLFKPTFYLPHTYFETEKIEKMTTMWTNFAKYGDPTPEMTWQSRPRWKPLRQDNPSLFVIDQEFSTEPLWKDNAMLIWNATYTKYRRKK